MKNVIASILLAFTTLTPAMVYAENIDINNGRVEIQYDSFCKSQQCEAELKAFVLNFRREPVTDAELESIYNDSGKMQNDDRHPPHKLVASARLYKPFRFQEGAGDFQGNDQRNFRRNDNGFSNYPRQHHFYQQDDGNYHQRHNRFQNTSYSDHYQGHQRDYNR
jgi:hypothetical protein